jgi:hypothetical protein
VKVTREDDEEKKAIFVKEYEMTKDLSHKNVVRSLEMF